MQVGESLTKVQEKSSRLQELALIRYEFYALLHGIRRSLSHG